tara:strand:+ start:238 stop:1833 length:1596 start_codon:yes stop_codon:yes gene_type:complete
MAKTLLQQLQERMGGQYADDQRGLLDEYLARQGYQDAGGAMVNELAEQPNLIPLAQDPYHGIREITPPRPGGGDTFGDLLYDFASKASREPEGGRVNRMLDIVPRGVATAVRKRISPTEDVGILDVASAGFDLGIMGLPKLIKNYVMNMRNYVPGFYSGNKAPGVALNVGKAFEEGSLDLTRKLYSASEVPLATKRVIRKHLDDYNELKKLGEEGGYTEEIRSAMRDAVRKIDGQVAQNILHSKMMANYGEKIPQVFSAYAERRFGYEMPFDRQLAGDMFDDVDAEMIYDMSREAWTEGFKKGLSGGRMQGPSDVIFLNKKNIRAAGDSLSDVGKSRQASVLKSLKAKHDPQTAEEWQEVLDKYDPEWKKKVPMSIRQGTDGVFFQFSPAGRRDYLLGGFNAIVKVKNDGTMKMFGTDKQDIFGQKIPGSADAIVGIGTREISIGGKQLVDKPTPRYKNPPKKKSDNISVESAKESQKTKPKVPRPEQGFLSKEDEALFNAILSDADSIAPDRITASLAATLGLIGNPYED